MLQKYLKPRDQRAEASSSWCFEKARVKDDGWGMGVGLGGLGGEIGEYPIIIANVNTRICFLFFPPSLPHHCSIHDPSPTTTSTTFLLLLSLDAEVFFSKTPNFSFFKGYTCSFLCSKRGPSPCKSFGSTGIEFEDAFHFHQSPSPFVFVCRSMKTSYSKPIFHGNPIMRGLRACCRKSSKLINKILSPMDVLCCLLQVHSTAFHL